MQAGSKYIPSSLLRVMDHYFSSKETGYKSAVCQKLKSPGFTFKTFWQLNGFDVVRFSGQSIF
jgi:hypothetical protein